MVQEGKTILVLGGGVGGLVAAHELRKQLPRPHRVVLIERSTMHLFTPPPALADDWSAQAADH